MPGHLQHRYPVPEPDRQAARPVLPARFGLRYIQQNDLRAITGQRFGDRRTNAACRARHHGLAPGQRAGPVLHLARAGTQVDELARDERCLGREEEAQGTLQLILRVVIHLQQLDRGAVAHFLGQ